MNRTFVRLIQAMTKKISPRSLMTLGLTFSFCLITSFTSSSIAEKYQPVRSDIIKAYMYDADTSVLTIYFLNGQIHEYQSVPERIYTGLKNAPLKGGYYTTWIQENFKTASATDTSPEEDPTPETNDDK